MNLEQLALIAEIIGATAIILTLVYLSIQVKDSARASKSASVTDATTAIQAFYQELGSNSETCKLYLAGLKNPEALSEQDQFQFLMMTHSGFLGFQRSFSLVSEGTLDVSLRDSIGTPIRTLGHMPGFKFYWRQRKSYFQPDFIEWIESILESEKLTGMDVFQVET